MNFIFPRLRNRITILIIFIIAIPALWYNLGLVGFNDDEAIRALVALEMDLTGNYLVPTLNGNFYYAKPPLYNWFLSIYCNVFDGYTEFNTRSLTVLFLLLYLLIIYHFSKTYFLKRYALINALLFLTCGRVLYWDSMLGYIDIAYSAVTFLSFMLIYHYYKKGKLLELFVFSYALMAIGFLLKGLPSILFQAISLGVLFVFFEKWKNAISWKHFAGIVTALIIISCYYIPYFNVVSSEHSALGLWDQSVRRTFFERGFSETLLFILQFPFKYVYHFLPWSLMLIFLFRFKFSTRLLNHDYLKFCWYVFLFNLPIYWLSPGTIPRYVLMLMPLLFTVLLAQYQMHFREKTVELKIFEWAIFLTIILAGLLSVYPLFDDRFDSYALVLPICLLMFAGISYLGYRYIINEKNRLLTAILVYLIFRTGLDIFYLPEKAKESRLNQCKTEALAIAERNTDSELQVHWQSKVGNIASFYITREKQEIIERHPKWEGSNSLIISKSMLDLIPESTAIDSFNVCEDPPEFVIIRKDN